MFTETACSRWSTPELAASSGSDGKGRLPQIDEGARIHTDRLESSVSAALSLTAPCAPWCRSPPHTPPASRKCSPLQSLDPRLIAAGAADAEKVGSTPLLKTLTFGPNSDVAGGDFGDFPPLPQRLTCRGGSRKFRCRFLYLRVTPRLTSLLTAHPAFTHLRRVPLPQTRVAEPASECPETLTFSDDTCLEARSPSNAGAACYESND